MARAKLAVIIHTFSVYGLAALGADFNEIIHNPEKFDGRRVTIAAMATVGGDRFYLYQFPEPKLLGADPRVIYGSLSAEGPDYDRYNHKEVVVTGIVDARYRGLAGENACSLRIERVRLASGRDKAAVICRDRACIETTFSQLLRDPTNYRHRCICISGFAHVRGDAFVLYEDEKATKNAHLARTRAIFVSHPSDLVDYNRYNRRWVKIKGTVDLEQRGFTAYPAGIIAEQVEAARSSNN